MNIIKNAIAAASRPPSVWRCRFSHTVPPACIRCLRAAGYFERARLQPGSHCHGPGHSSSRPDLHIGNALTESKIPFLLYDRTAANPTSDNVEAVRTLCLKHHCDAIIGFGGGSSMDCAKAAGARIVRPGVP